ncbi:uncharacterized protein BDR25DRAFT_357042 [Lindgomyces ingoldianus]|uniref:Uncharacterized protein n=1 Tax=Lindgomyces ingoldianus TaxID=673940 RepID=A0ACB6QQ73_9PLEO|nr:uncharacterized protein BDR25DRAFT_357042 [Lindgomyces ingoldianus]KAF2468685.1 hypothetical protein BDR25DRAFT_357042 [Lindgomyces ingoldianus]
MNCGLSSFSFNLFWGRTITKKDSADSVGHSDYLDFDLDHGYRLAENIKSLLSILAVLVTGRNCGGCSWHSSRTHKNIFTGIDTDNQGKHGVVNPAIRGIVETCRVVLFGTRVKGRVSCSIYALRGLNTYLIWRESIEVSMRRPWAELDYPATY